MSDDIIVELESLEMSQNRTNCKFHLLIACAVFLNAFGCANSHHNDSSDTQLSEEATANKVPTGQDRNKEKVLPPKKTFGEKLDDFGEGISEVVESAVSIVFWLGYCIAYGMTSDPSLVNP